MNDLVKCRFAVFASSWIGWQEHVADSIEFGQFCSDLFFGDPPQELVGHGCHDSRAVARIGFASARAAVVHVTQDAVCIDNDLSRAFAFHVRDEPDAAAIVFEFGQVQAVRFR